VVGNHSKTSMFLLALREGAKKLLEEIGQLYP
jgi:hypothetical protein